MSLVRLRALLNITAEKLDEKEDDEFIICHFRFIAVNLLSGKASNELLELCLKCLTNLCYSAQRNQLLFDSFSSNTDRLEFVSKLKGLLHSTDHRLLAIGLLCNLTRTELWLNYIVEESDEQWLTLLFPPASLLQDTVALVLNLSTNQKTRQRLCSNSTWISRLVSSFDSETNSNNALLFAGVLKNCCFEDDYHMTLLDDSIGFLEAVLLRLCGPEDQIDQEDRQVLPKRVQSVIGTSDAIRSNCFKLKTTLCQALLQLCATSDGRTRLRSRGVYFVLRELHKYEHSQIDEDDTNNPALTSYKELVYYLEQVVDQLICEERERDREAVETSLRNIPVDEQTCEKLNRIKLESVGCLETEVDV